MATDADPGPLCPVHGDRGVPPDPGTVATLDLLVTGEFGFVLRGYRVDVVGRGHHRHAEVEILRVLEQAQHDLATTGMAVGCHQRIERLTPFGGLLRILIGVMYRVRVLIVYRHR